MPELGSGSTRVPWVAVGVLPSSVYWSRAPGVGLVRLTRTGPDWNPRPWEKDGAAVKPAMPGPLGSPGLGFVKKRLSRDWPMRSSAWIKKSDPDARSLRPSRAKRLGPVCSSAGGEADTCQATGRNPSTFARDR